MFRSPVRLALAMVALLAAAPAQAGPPISRGELYLRVSFTDCMVRARGAFQALGWGNVGSQANVVSGFREIHSAYIVCNQAPDGVQVVNIFVASDQGDGGVPGYQRQLLQQAMVSPNAPAPRPAGGLVVPRQGGSGPVWLFADSPSGGRSVAIRWQGGTNASRDWVTIVPAGTPDSSAGNWKYTGGATAGTLSWGELSPGSYQARFYYNDGYTLGGRLEFDVR